MQTRPFTIVSWLKYFLQPTAVSNIQHTIHAVHICDKDTDIMAWFLASLSIFLLKYCTTMIQECLHWNHIYSSSHNTVDNRIQGSFPMTGHFYCTFALYNVTFWFSISLREFGKGDCSLLVESKYVMFTNLLLEYGRTALNMYTRWSIGGLKTCNEPFQFMQLKISCIFIHCVQLTATAITAVAINTFFGGKSRI